MQKKIIALAIAGLASTAAFAQSNVTIYGRLDYGYMSRSGDINGVNFDRKSELASGVQAGSRLGFKGSEDLGGGLKAIFEIEYNLQMDTNVGIATTARHQYVGLTGNFGTVVGGFLDGVRYGIFNKYDAFAGGTVANFTQVTAQVDRANNAIAYISPNWSGFSFLLATSTHIGSNNPLGLGAQEGSAAAAGRGNDGDARLATIMANYAQGPIDITADWERVSFKSGGIAGSAATPSTVNTAGAGCPAACVVAPGTPAVAPSTASILDEVTVWTIAGSYDFGVVKVRALWDQLKADARNGGDTKTQSWFLSASAPIGDKFVLKATYGQTKVKEVADSKAKKFGLGMDYNLSKRTNIYADFGSISNDSASFIGISPLGNGMNAGANLYGKRGFDLGIAHKF